MARRLGETLVCSGKGAAARTWWQGAVEVAKRGGHGMMAGR